LAFLTTIAQNAVRFVSAPENCTWEKVKDTKSDIVNLHMTARVVCPQFGHEIPHNTKCPESRNLQCNPRDVHLHPIDSADGSASAAIAPTVSLTCAMSVSNHRNTAIADSDSSVCRECFDCHDANCHSHSCHHSVRATPPHPSMPLIGNISIVGK
jgi:hypothetical protein